MTFSNPVRVRFGAGSLSCLDEVLAGRRAALLTSPGAGRRGLVDRVCAAAGDRVTRIYADIEPNPTIASAVRAHAALAGDRFDVLIAAGGGSVIDTAKAVAAQLASPTPGWLAACLREGKPFPTNFAPSPIVAIPTTAGTGSEVTMWATIWDETTRTKYSLSHPSLYPEAALVDPALTIGAPANLTITTSLDALSHAMEAIWNKHHNPVSDALATRAISVIVATLPAALESPDDLARRGDLHSASLLAGLAFSNTRTALAHSISYPLTAERGLPHGFACSFTLAEVLSLNADADRARMSLIAAALGCADVLEAQAALYRVLNSVRLGDRLRAFVPTAGDIDALTGTMITPGRADNNLADVTEAGARALAKRAFARLVPG